MIVRLQRLQRAQRRLAAVSLGALSRQVHVELFDTQLRRQLVGEVASRMPRGKAAAGALAAIDAQGLRLLSPA